MEEDTLYFRRLFSEEDLDLQDIIGEFLQYGPIEDDKCFSKTTKAGYITYLAFTTEKAWKDSASHPISPLFKIKTTDRPANSHDVGNFYRLYLKYPKNSTLTGDEIAQFFNFPEETESISPNTEKGYIIVYLKSSEAFFKYLNNPNLHKNNKALSVLQSLCFTNDKKYLRLWILNLPSRELSPQKIWVKIKSVFKISTTPLHSGKDRDLCNRPLNRIFFWIHSPSDACSLQGKSIEFMRQDVFSQKTKTKK